MQIEAAVLRDRTSAFCMETVELAGPGRGEVRVRIAGVGFCHTDVLPRTADFMAVPPLVVGHEGAGVVEALGDGVGNDLEVGQPVVLSFDSCGLCENCLVGSPAYCTSFFALNLTGNGGDGTGPITDSGGKAISSRWFGQSSFATHAIVTATNVVPVPRDLPLELLGPLACGVQTGAGSIFNSLGVRAGHTTLVFGAGAVGLSAVMAAKVAGAKRIIAVDLNESRLELAVELGATDVIHGGDTDVARQVRKLTGGGVNAALDTTGQPSVIAAGVDALRPTGTLGLVSAASRNVVLAGSALAAGKTITGILEGDAVPRTFLPLLIDLWSRGLFPFDKLIRTYPMSEIAAAERDCASGLTIKPVLIPRSD
ncbi:NAD(P)-dependent alcohol dehydrogenase [Actinomycetes bacterium M1A6_2h]